MQTIVCKYLGPTDYMGSRIKAMTSNKRFSAIHDWDYSMSNEQNYKAAAQALAEKLQWTGSWAGHHAPRPYDWIFCNVAADLFAPTFFVEGETE